MLDAPYARFLHLYFCQSLHTLQRDLATIAVLLVFHSYHCIVAVKCKFSDYSGPVAMTQRKCSLYIDN